MARKLLILASREPIPDRLLEGTITDPQQQALFQYDPKYPKTQDASQNAFQEVFNYRHALSTRHINKEDDLPLSLRLIKDLHRILMHDVRGSDQNPGEFRRSQNVVGRPARYVPPPLNYLNDTLNRFELYLHDHEGFDPLVQSFLVHYQFEAIHPFGDGNGRVGRLLLAITVAEWCQLSNQWLYMSEYFERHKDDYIDLMFRVSTHGDWEGWIEFCLGGVAEQSSLTKLRCERLVSTYRDFRERLNGIGGNIRLSSIVDNLFDSAVVRVATLARKQRVSYPTARADLKKLEAVGIISELSNVNPITYYCPEIYAITYAEMDDIG